MASSKNKLTEDQLVEGIISKILKSIFNRRTRQVLDSFKDNPALKQATDDFISATTQLNKSLKRVGIE